MTHGTQRLARVSLTGLLLITAGLGGGAATAAGHSPALGGWRVVASVGSDPVVWTTSVHPLPSSPSVLATAALIDQGRLVAGLFNGPLIPGGRGWHNGNHVMAAAVPALLAAFNGGFEFRHIKGGYMTEGRIMKPLKADQATLGITHGGRLVLGIYGVDMTNDGSWESLRQNLPPVVIDGQVSVGRYPGTYWGDNYGHVVSSYRSAICTVAGGNLMYVAMGKVDVNQLAAGLVRMGCRLAMQLDMNGGWPQFATYSNPGSSRRSGLLVDRRMSNNNRYLKASSKDFIALFDPHLLPPGTLA